jgi:hypothetical protein
LARLIEDGGKECKVIYELISKICEEGIMAHERKYGIIGRICKKGDGMMHDNY